MHLPPPPDRSFASDNAAGAHPAVLEAVARANHGHALAYGDDAWTKECEGAFRELLSLRDFSSCLSETNWFEFPTATHESLLTKSTSLIWEGLPDSCPVGPAGPTPATEDTDGDGVGCDSRDT